MDISLGEAILSTGFYLTTEKGSSLKVKDLLLVRENPFQTKLGKQAEVHILISHDNIKFYGV